MANVNVSYDQMQQEAQALISGKEQINQQLQLMRNRINNLVSAGFVTDQASGAFSASYEQFNQGAVMTISALDQLANNLNMVANTLQQTDAALAAQMGNG